MQTKIQINSQFDGGNIDVVQCDTAADIQLKIRPDSEADFKQWFYFRVSGIQDQRCRIRLINAADCSYPNAWSGYRVVASLDRHEWFRIDTQYDNGELILDYTSEADTVYFAYFAPYSMERHADLVASAATEPDCHVIQLGETLDGRALDLLQIGELAANKKVCWVIARQHPGETMAEWWVEGFLGRLLDEHDAVSRSLLSKMVFYVVPNMNPDGSFRGNLRTNAAGENLNRKWLDADLKSSPEVYNVRQKMHETGVDICFDVHGDEALPYNFIASSEGIEDWNAERQGLLDLFKNTLCKMNPDFQRQHGYPVTPAGKANLAMCSNYVAATFGCLAMTHEMPFIDTADTPHEWQGWSPERAQRLGASNLDVIHHVFDQL